MENIKDYEQALSKIQNMIEGKSSMRASELIINYGNMEE